ncbi:MAG: AtpZ/AtpI family protein [Saprospiraceae bacterium]|nr:AtpZ/AtpI family protein [Saprospiraceae bacterium]
MSPQERRKSAIKATAKYGGMAFQLLGACLAGVFIGKWLDRYVQTERPLWAVFLTIFFMVASLYSIYRQLLKDN